MASGREQLPMPDIISIPVADLLFDEENPRIISPNEGQRETLRALAQLQGPKLRVLAQDILTHGVSPSELNIVFERPDKRFTVLEGNRRLAAIRALENPDSIADAVAPSVLMAIRKLGREYQQNPIDELRCVLVKDRGEAHHWIELRHMGELEGAGLTTWGSDERERFRARTGQTLAIHTQALDFLERRGDLTPEIRRQVAVTTLRRLLETPVVRGKLGIEWSRGTLKLLAAESRVVKALLYVVNDIASGRIKVGDVYTKKQRTTYAKNLPSSIVVTPTAKPGEGKPVKPSQPEKPTKRKTPSVSRLRERLIPHDCALNISDERLQDIERELRLLSLDTHTNAVSVLFRVFIELSVDSYIDRAGLPVSKDNDSLAKKLTASASHLVGQKKLTADQTVPVRRAAQKDSFLAPSVRMMQSWVHNPHVFPGPTDLRAHWNSLQPWIIAVWGS